MNRTCVGQINGLTQFFFIFCLGPVFVKETDNCQYIFSWATRLACPPYKVGACAVTGDDGNNYDLSGLSRVNDNYVYTDTVKNKRYIINVCRSLISQTGKRHVFNLSMA